MYDLGPSHQHACLWCVLISSTLGTAGSEVIVNNPFLLLVAEQQLESL